MSVIDRLTNYLATPPAQVKVCLGVMIASAITALAGPLSWTQYGAIHTGSQMLVHGADVLLGRLTQGGRPAVLVPARVPVPVAQGAVRAAQPVLNGGLSEEEAMERALRNSMHDIDDDYKSFEEAARQSAFFMDEMDPRRLVECDLDSISGTESRVTPEFAIKVGSNQFHLFNLLFALLSQPEMQNPFDRQPLKEESVIEIACRLGINPDEFVNIWALSKAPGFAPTHIDPDTEAGLKIDMRFQLARQMLESKDGSLEQLATRKKMLLCLSQMSVWREQMAKPPLF